MSYTYKIPFGSQVYGLINKESDKDYIYIKPDNSSFESTSKDDEVFTTTEFQKLLDLHDVKALETYFYSEEVQTDFDFKLNVNILRSAVSKVVSNAHVKAKKKIKDEEIYIGLKSYYHCIRLLTMFTYLARHRTFDPSRFKYELDYVYQDIVMQRQNQPNSETLFQDLEADYKKLLKSLQHTFRMYCPK